MNVSIYLGWWLIPAAITAAMWCWYFVRMRAEPRSYGDYSFGRAFAFLFYGGGALIVTLGVWLVYFITIAILATI